MSRIRLVLAIVVVLLLAACSSDTAIHVAPSDSVAVEGDPWRPTPPAPGGIETDPHGPLDPGGPGRIDPPDPGPWGNLDPGSLPDVHFAVAYSDWDCVGLDSDGLGGGPDPGEGPFDTDDDEVDDEPQDSDDEVWGGCPVRFAVVDLLGQVIAEFPLPYETEGSTPYNHLSLAPAGPGQFLAVVENWGDVDGDGDSDGASDAFWQGTFWEAWRGDAFTGTIDQVAFWNGSDAAVQLTETGRQVDLGGWQGWAQLAIDATEPDWLMLWSGFDDCQSLRELRAVHLGNEGFLDRVWTAEDLLPPELLAAADEEGEQFALWPWNLDAGLDESGQGNLLIGVTTASCNPTEEPWQLVAWSPDDGPMWSTPATATSYWPPHASWVGHGGGAALQVDGIWSAPTWRVTTAEGQLEGSLDDTLTLYNHRAGPMLDPAGPTFMTVATFIDDLDGDGIDQYYGVLDVHHEGSQVWRIDKLRFGLAERRVFFVDVVRLPPSLE